LLVRVGSPTAAGAIITVAPRAFICVLTIHAIFRLLFVIVVSKEAGAPARACCSGENTPPIGYSRQSRRSFVVVNGLHTSSQRPVWNDAGGLQLPSGSTRIADGRATRCACHGTYWCGVVT
jgi:hypothetical protein